MNVSSSPPLDDLLSTLCASLDNTTLQPLVIKFKQELNERYPTHPDILTAFSQLEKQPQSRGRQLVFQEEWEKTGASTNTVLLEIVRQMATNLFGSRRNESTVTANDGSAVAVGQRNTVLGPGAINISTGDIKAESIVIAGNLL